MKSAQYEKLYESKATGLLLYGRALGLSHAEAEDVLQETFVALFQMSNIPEDLEHYCVRSFRNRALNHRRSLWRRIAREFESRRWFERSVGETPQEKAAMECLAQLPPGQRETIVLKIWNAYTFEEIGELLALSPNTVAGRYRYGLQKLRACLIKELYERNEPLGETFGILDSRPPSAKVKQRLFAQPVQNPPAASYSHWLLGTAAASLVILLMWTLPKTTGGQSGLALASLPAGSNKMDVLCSNIIGFYANDGSSCRHNNSSDNTFDWTKASHSLSTTGSFPVWKTNIQKL